MPLDPLKHKNILIKILKDIYSDTSIAPFLGFKGGTAAYLFYDLPRHSIDLDFDLLESTKDDHVLLKIEQIVKKYGQLKEARKKRFTLFASISYGLRDQNVKIEVNRRPSLDSKYSLKTYLGISMLVIDKEDMFANKLIAMNNRIGKTNRDIYDVWFFLENNWPINKDIVKKRSGMTFKQFVEKSISSLESVDNNNILGGMGELLDNKQKVWVKNNLIKDTIFLLKLNLEQEH